MASAKAQHAPTNATSQTVPTLKIQEEEQGVDTMESIAKDDKQDDDRKPAAKTRTQSKAETNAIYEEGKQADYSKTIDRAQEFTAESKPERTCRDETRKEVDVLEDKAGILGKGSAATLAEDFESSDEEPEPIQQVEPRKWRRLHDKWLHAAMRVAMGDTTLKSILDLDNILQPSTKYSGLRAGSFDYSTL